MLPGQSVLYVFAAIYARNETEKKKIMHHSRYTNLDLYMLR